MLPLTLAEVAAACAGRLVGGDPQTIVETVSTDSRSIAPGDLFVGLRGERFDGEQHRDPARTQPLAAVVHHDGLP